MANIDLTELKQRVEAGLLTVRKHPSADLWIYNYTPQTQYSRAWDEYTLMCRGLIVDTVGNIVARPFPKFFNLEEYKGDIPNEPFTVNEKMDGSLFIVAIHNGKIVTATRGSFESDQAKVGTELLSHYIGGIENGKTYLFECIYPQNRIVIDYGGESKLVLLAVVDTATGVETPLADVRVPFEKAPQYDGITDLAVLRAIEEDTGNREGYVVHFESGLRLKLKFDEYVRLHRILTETSSTVIWEVLAVEDVTMRCPELSIKQVGDAVRHIDRNKIEPIMTKNGKALEGLLDNVPDEFYGWLRQTMSELTAGKDKAIAEASEMVRMHGSDRLAIIKACGEDKTKRAIALSMVDGKEATAYGLAWRSVKPEWGKPFMVDSE